LDFVTGMQCVYCAVGNLHLRILQLDFRYWALKIENLDKSQSKLKFKQQNEKKYLKCYQMFSQNCDLLSLSDS